MRKEGVLRVLTQPLEARKNQKETDFIMASLDWRTILAIPN